MSVVVSMPFFGCHEWVRQAVASILGQTRDDLRLVVVNDADPTPPWPLLGDIRDDRLIRFDLPENRGRYFADAVVLAATDDEWFAVQDPDDWACPDRLEVAIDAATTGVALAPATDWKHKGPRVLRQRIAEPVTRDRVQVTAIGWLGGVMRRDRVEAVGGSHPGYRVAYDNLFTNLLKLGPWDVVDKPLVNKRRRFGGLSTAPATAMRSQYRQQQHERRLALWQRAWDAHARGGSVADVIRADIDAGLAAEVRLHAARLREML